MLQQTIMILLIAVLLGAGLLVVSMPKASAEEPFVTPQQPNIPGFKGVITPQVYHTLKREPPQPTHVAGQMDFKAPSYTDLIFRPGITPKNGLPKHIGKDCSFLCDPDGTCNSAAFYECLNVDSSRYGTIGRGRVAFNQNFESVLYNQTVSVH